NEAIVTDALYSDPDLGSLLRELPAVTPLTRDVFDGATAERRLCDYFAVATMDGLSAMSRLEATAAAAAVTYIDRTPVGKRPPLSPPSRATLLVCATAFWRPIRRWRGSGNLRLRQQRSWP